MFKVTQRLIHSSPASLQKLYVGNLSWNVTEDTVRTLFSKYGQVSDCFIIRDKLSGRSRGFGFVEMDNSEEAAQAKQELDGFVQDGRNLKVNEAIEKPREF